MTNIFTMASTVIFLFLFIIWNTKDALNQFLKAVFMLMTTFGIVIFLESIGYIIKP